MNIGQAAEKSGVTAKMIRYYEQIGLIEPPYRTDSNYRRYGPSEIHVLRFIKRARTLGFSLEETSALLGLWRDRNRSSSEVKEIATNHIAELETKIGELEGMVKTLKHLVHCCQGNDRPDCPILDDLAEIDPTKGH